MDHSRSLFHLFSSFLSTVQINRQQESNSGCRSRNPECWPLDHHHGSCLNSNSHSSTFFPFRAKTQPFSRQNSTIFCSKTPPFFSTPTNQHETKNVAKPKFLNAAKKLSTCAQNFTVDNFQLSCCYFRQIVRLTRDQESKVWCRSLGIGLYQSQPSQPTRTASNR